MGDSPVRPFKVAAVISLATGDDFAPRSDVEDLIAHLLGRTTVNLKKLYGTEVLKARRALVLQHGHLLGLRSGAETFDGHERLAYVRGFLDAAEHLYGYPAEVGKSGEKDTNRYIFVRGLDYA